MEGLRAWIGEVERKLGKRTRVFLALTVIAIGIAGASLYLAIDARNSSVSESDVQALQERLEARFRAGSSAAAAPSLEAEPAPEGDSAPAPSPKKKQGNGASGSAPAPGGATGGAANSAKLEELLQQAKERSEENE